MNNRFLRNSRDILIGTALCVGSFLSVNAIYEFYAEKKLIQCSKNNDHKSNIVLKYIANTLDQMSISEKGFAGSSLIYGGVAAMLLASRRKRLE